MGTGAADAPAIARRTGIAELQREREVLRRQREEYEIWWKDGEELMDEIIQVKGTLWIRK